MYKHLYELGMLIILSGVIYLIWLQIKPMIVAYLHRREHARSMREAIDKAREAHSEIRERREVNENLKEQIDNENKEAEDFIGKKQ